MKAPSEWVLNALLQSLLPERRATLEGYLPPPERRQIQSLPTPEPLIQEKEPPILDRIHWSWFLPFLQSYTKEEQRLFVALLPESARGRLNQEIGIPPTPALKLHPPLEPFLKQTLLGQIAV